MDSANWITHEVKNDISVIRLNRPDKKNALNTAMYRALNRYLSVAASSRVVVLTGQEDCFTAGHDLHDFATAQTTEDFQEVTDFLLKIATYPIPLIAAVSGPCIGIGTTLLLHCDLVYAGSTALFQLPFVRLGLTPEAGSSYLLPKLGPRFAAQALLLGEPFSAQVAYQHGLINEIVDTKDVFDFSLQKAALVARHHPTAVAACKKLLKRADEVATLHAIETELPIFFQQLQHPDTQKAFHAFLKT